MGYLIDDIIKRPCAFVLKVDRPLVTHREILGFLSDRKIRVSTIHLHCESDMEGILIIHCLIERDRIKHVQHQLEKIIGIRELEMLEAKGSNLIKGY
jgi:hypothetical protein